MFSLTSFFVSPAWADTADAMPPASDLPSILMRYMPVILIFLVFYFLLIRPQQKKFEEQNAMIKALKKGDKVVALGGLVGTISKLEGDDYLMVEVAKGVELKILRASVTEMDKPKYEQTEKKA